MHRSLLPLLALLAIGAHAQQLYKSIGPDGKVVYSDRPPAEGRVEKTMKLQEAPTSALDARSNSYVEQLRRLRASTPVLPPPEDTVLFSAKWCGYCKLAKAYLAGRSIPFREVDIDTHAGLAAFAGAGGNKGIPLLVKGSTRIQGFSEDSYAAAFPAAR